MSLWSRTKDLFFLFFFCILSNTDTPTPPEFSSKHLNCMLCKRGRGTEAKVKWPKRSIHVSPDKIGNYTLHMPAAKEGWMDGWTGIAHAGAWASRNRLLSSNHRQGNVEISVFPRSKRTDYVHAAHKHKVWERETAIRGMFGIEISVFVGFEGICGDVCVSLPQFAA